MGTGATPKGLENWPAPLADTASGHEDRTAPSLFPTPEDDGQEQRPYPPPDTPAPLHSREMPTAVTSSLIGLAAVGLLVIGFAFVLGLWVAYTGRLNGLLL